jgi:hypothetical protein
LKVSTFKTKRRLSTHRMVFCDLVFQPIMTTLKPGFRSLGASVPSHPVIPLFQISLLAVHLTIPRPPTPHRWPRANLASDSVSSHVPQPTASQFRFLTSSSLASMIIYLVFKPRNIHPDGSEAVEMYPYILDEARGVRLVWLPTSVDCGIECYSVIFPDRIYIIKRKLCWLSLSQTLGGLA